jgi:hypothetical protein
MKTIHRIRYFQFSLILSVAQLLFAVALWVDEPFQLVRDETKALNATMAEQHMPPLSQPPRLGGQSILFRPSLAGRILYVVNLPPRRLAEVLSRPIHSGPVWGFTWPLGDDPWYPKSGTVVYQVGSEEIIFFLGVILLWFYVGNKIDRFMSNRKPMIATKHQLWRFIELGALLAIGASLLINCVAIIAHEQCCPQERKIAILGLVWPLALFLYCAANMKSVFRMKKTLPAS